MASLVVQWLRNPPCNTGHRFSPWFGKISYAAGKLSLCITTTEAYVPRAWAPQQKKATIVQSLAPQLESSPDAPQLDKA